MLAVPPGTPTTSSPPSSNEPVEQPAVDKPLSPELVRAFYIGGGVLGVIALISIAISLARPRAPAPIVVVLPPPPPVATLPVAPAPVLVAPPPPPVLRPRPATAPAIRSLESTATTAPVEVRPRRIVAVRPPPSAIMDNAELDDRIGRAIDAGCDYLIGKFKDGILPDATAGTGEAAGRDALTVYALLQASKASNRTDLSADTPLTNRMLTALAAMPMSSDKMTYDRSLRVQALSVYNRAADRKTLSADATWLAKVGRAGGYNYDPPTHTGTLAAINAAYLTDEANGSWDNSNSQYGALGVWAAEDAGVTASAQYWGAVRKHWLQSQRPNGQWGYQGPTSEGRLSMTVAGLTMMFVAEDHLGVGSAVEEAGHPAYSAAVARGLAWLGTDDNAVSLAADYMPTYTLYGLERAGLASGIKTFGKHDWYRELAAKQVLAQTDDGSWARNVVDTAFSLLFLSRGRHPILFDKLQYDGAWANRPRDVANLTQYASKELERPFNWQVVPLSAGWTNWMDAPVLFMPSHVPPPLTDADVDQLRLYAENGGLLFTAADLASPTFNKYVAELAGKLFPRYPLRDLPPDHPIYRSLFPLATKSGTPPPRLQGVSNGSRLLLVHSPLDVGRAWQLHGSAGRPGPFQLGLNVFIYAAGKSEFRNRLRTSYIPEPTVKPLATTAIARVRYDGDWDPEPAAAGRFARAFLNDTSIAVTVADMDVANLDARSTPVALLTGTGDVRMTPPQLQVLHKFVTDGGILVTDACGGSPDARKALLERILPNAFPERAATDLPGDHPIVAGTFPGMTPFDAKLRRFASEASYGRSGKVQAILVGDGIVLFSPLDVTTGLLGTNTWGVDGYRPDTAYALVRNALLYALERAPLFGRS